MSKKKTKKVTAAQGKSGKKKSARAKKAPVRQFTTKQQRYIDCYDGSIKKAAKKAGITYGYARKLGTKRDILDAIRRRQDIEVRPKDIADRQERQAFWTEIMRNGDEDTRDRLKAAELLGKSEADFTENLAHKFPESCGVMVVSAQMDPKQWRKQSEEHHKNGSGNRNTD